MPRALASPLWILRASSAKRGPTCSQLVSTYRRICCNARRNSAGVGGRSGVGCGAAGASRIGASPPRDLATRGLTLVGGVVAEPGLDFVARIAAEGKKNHCVINPWLFYIIT